MNARFWTTAMSRLRRWRAARGGNVALTFALAAPLLAAGVMGTVDVHRALSAKQVLQDSLDAATLYAARSNASTDADLQTVGARALAGNIYNLRSGSLVSSQFRTTDEGRVVVSTAQASVPATILGLFGQNRLIVNASAEVERSSKNIELALILDVTGSMAGQRVIDLRAAAKDLIDLVVKTKQKPHYTKIAIVPYSMGVNVGTYAQAVRGPIAAGVNVTGATKANPVVITASNHGFQNGDRVYLTGIGGMSQINNRAFIVANRTTNTFALQNEDGRKHSNFTSGGQAHCTTAGCEWFWFMNAASPSAERVHRVSTCVTERHGTHAYTDAAPTTALLGRNYPSTSNACLPNRIRPLTSDRAALKADVDALQAGGSTGGHIGVAWGWYMISPNFGYLWPQESRPAAYGEDELLKVVVLMTDGEYNSSYCNGVISRDSTSGSGAIGDKINCNAPNGHAFDQALALCAAMKQRGVLVYTVGLDIVSDPRAQTLVHSCATDPSYVYLPSGGKALREAFRAIANDINEVRITR